MDGLLIIDKPAGPTSHDVVARLRRALGERRVGHTGTLDPAATGVLPLVVGRAMRLARFLSAGDKSYDAVIRLGISTDTADAEGTPLGSAFARALPSREAIDRALDRFRGSFLQQPPVFSAKKIGGKRSHRLARSQTGVRLVSDTPQTGVRPVSDSTLTPAPVRVTVHRLEIVDVEADRVTVSLDCSAGFYVRSLAHDLGQTLGTGAHLERLRRTRSGDCTLAGAIDLATAELDDRRLRTSVIPMSQMLPRLSSVILTSDGVRHAAQGRDLAPHDAVSPVGKWESGYLRMMNQAGELIGIAEPAHAPGLLHPLVVLI